MERKSFNDVLKAKEAERAAKKANDDHIALDDAKRVKVLSPGQLVFKRFIRNKLAIFGVCVLVVMFLFSFAGPLFYKYDYKTTFFKFGLQYNKYAQATYRKEYTNYPLTDATISNHVKNGVTSAVNKLESDKSLDWLLIVSPEGDSYLLSDLGPKVYTLSENRGALTATSSTENTPIATYASMEKTAPFTYVEEMDARFEAAFLAALGENAKGKPFTFTYNDQEYSVTWQTKMDADIARTGETLTFSGADLGDGFKEAYKAALEAEQGSFAYAGKTYCCVKDRGITSIYAVIPGEELMISSTLGYSGERSEDKDFLALLYHSVYETDAFTYDGERYTIHSDEADTFVIANSEGEDVGMLSNFIVKDFNGNDTVSVENKEAIQEVVEMMIATGQTGISSDTTKETVPEDEEPDPLAPADDEEGGAEEEESLETADGIPVTLMFEEKVAGYEGEKPTLTDVYDENGEHSYVPFTGKIIKDNDGYYTVSCDQWKYLMDMNGRPSGSHVLGTDTDGYDVLSRIMYGGRVSLLVGFVVVIIETILGVIMGGIAGYFGKWVDNLIMRLVDIFYCIPSMPILIIMGAFMDDQKLDPIPRLIYMMAILGVLGWAGVARLVRGQILSLREQEFMVATEATGVKVSRRIFRHLIPNVMPQLIVSATAGLGGVILTESTLSFLGLGVKRPMATWGAIISGITSSNENILNYTHIWIPVGLLICLTVIAFNFVGDGLRDAFDPKMKR